MLDHVLARFFNQPHPCKPEKLDAIRHVLSQRMMGIQADGSLIAAVRAESQAARAVTVNRSVAVLPIVGTIMKRAGMMEEFSGGASTDTIGREFDRLVNDESVGAIVLDVHSPGGEGFGVPELAAKIFSARGKKPIEASVNAEMASAALWIGSAASKVNMTPSGWIGSHGVYMVHTDLSAANEQLGQKVSYISAGEYKVEWTSDGPLPEDARAYYQGQVNAIYDQFTKDLAAFRGMKPADVKANFGGGRMLRAEDAKRAGMIDRIETLEDTIARLAGAKTSARKGTAKARAELDLQRFQ